MTEAAPRKRRTRATSMLLVEPSIVDLETAATIVALSTSSWKALVRTGQAPKPRLLSANRVGWLLRELREWAEARPVSDLPPPPNAGRRRLKPSEG